MKITIDHTRCINDRFMKARCTVCRDICPAKAITEKLAIAESCTNCGLCLAYCPVEAIAGVDYSEQVVRENIAKNDAAVNFICRKHHSESRWPCLGFLDPVLLLAYVYSGEKAKRQVRIYQWECETCSVSVAEHIARTAKQAKQLLGTDDQLIVNAVTKPTPQNQQAVSRRQFFNELLDASLSTVREIAFPASEELRPIPRHTLFFNHVHLPAEIRQAVNQSTFKTLSIANECNACGLCSRICPFGALETVVEQNTLIVRHQPLLCRGCEVCAAHCSKEAISLKAAHTLNKQEVKSVILPVCLQCGNRFQPLGDSELCLDCFGKTKFL